jgi:hypothetical protein
MLFEEEFWLFTSIPPYYLDLRIDLGIVGLYLRGICKCSLIAVFFFAPCPFLVEEGEFSLKERPIRDFSLYFMVRFCYPESK